MLANIHFKHAYRSFPDFSQTIFEALSSESKQAPIQRGASNGGGFLRARRNMKNN